jgi:hypothetical protein
MFVAPTVNTGPHSHRTCAPSQTASSCTPDTVNYRTAVGAKDSVLLGAAVEHLVLSRLLSKGFLAAPAPRGTRKADILVNFIDGGHPCLIQVKAASKGRLGWHMQKKHEDVTDEDLFYCFVDFEGNHPRVWVIPAAVVADTIRTDHGIWLQTPGKNGQVHNDTKLRRFRHNCLGTEEGWLDQYFEAWGQLTPR